MKKTILIGVLLSFTFLAVAQTNYQKRRSKQKLRIQNGVKSGELTQEERQKLKSGQQKIREIAQGYRDDGKISKEERRSLKRAQTRQSKRVHRKKHN